MKDLADLDFHLPNDQPPAPGGKITHANQPVRLENLQRTPQMRVADREKPRSLGCRQFVWREIAAARRQEGQRAIVRNEMFFEEILGRSKSISKQTPQPSTTDFRPRTIEPLHGTFGMLLGRRANGCTNVHPIAHGSNFSKGHARLRHAERPGIHAEEDRVLSSLAEPPQIFQVRR